MTGRKIFGMAMIMCLCYSSGLFAQGLEEQNQLDIVKGRVVETDWVAGKLVVRIDDAYQPDQITLFVTRDTKITKGASDISLADILQMDYVTARYYVNSFAGLRAVSVEVRQ